MYCVLKQFLNTDALNVWQQGDNHVGRPCHKVLMEFKIYVNVVSLYELLLISYYVVFTDIGGRDIDRMFRRQKAFFFVGVVGVYILI